ncbi:phage recombination protein Bet [Bradyrhizobium sp. SZCCHNR2026]|uniref:phage recombination protein Bet n=1 Tax=Bradyrhizobium sp. SZCCHNR2026 TaxID=3057381 RepID=UPI0029168B50|nr:phage recombination protein Bet [Bradyrhizobium sp. SZCCHNR2026]
MNSLATLPRAALSAPAPWWNESKQVALVRRTAAKDCNPDEFDLFTAVCRDLGLSPLRRQIYAFVFNKNDDALRQLTLVVGIDGARSIAARSGNYRPDDQEPQWVFRDDLKDPLTNPHGIERCTVGIYHRPTRADGFQRIVHTVYWDEFAPLVTRADTDAYEWVPTGKFYADGHPKAGKEIHRRQLRDGAAGREVLRLDPNKTQWIRAGRNQLAKCAEMGALRKGWPEDLSRLVVEEETHRAEAIELNAEEYGLTPSQMVEKADADARLERIGGRALLATFDDAGTLERVAYGKFADRVDAHTQKLAPKAVAIFADRNRAALQEFWAHNKTDALALKRLLEQRAAVPA